jgi:hypothetical protein
MRRLGWVLVVGIALGLGACASPKKALERADRLVQKGDLRAALAAFDAVAGRRDATDAERVLALAGAAHACDDLGNQELALALLERAVEHDVPGVIEPIEYELAERLRDRDRARAVSLYYRAAAGAEKHRAGGFPYRAAMDRLLQLSMSR